MISQVSVLNCRKALRRRSNVQRRDQLGKVQWEINYGINYIFQSEIQIVYLKDLVLGGGEWPRGGTFFEINLVRNVENTYC